MIDAHDGGQESRILDVFFYSCSFVLQSFGRQHHTHAYTRSDTKTRNRVTATQNGFTASHAHTLKYGSPKTNAEMHTQHIYTHEYT